MKLEHAVKSINKQTWGLVYYFREENPRIGDVMMQAGPFLKMYTTYTQNFEQASKMLEVWLGKSKDFAALVKSIQAESKNKGLQLQVGLLISCTGH